MSHSEDQVMAFVAVIAEVCHEVNRAYCEAIGDFTVSSWPNTIEETKNNIYKGVVFRLTNPFSSPKDMHQNWMKDKVRDGWIHGPVKSEEFRTHPCIIAYEQLPEAQRVKDNLFMATVDSLRKVFGV
jgi:hypothetical protein